MRINNNMMSFNNTINTFERQDEQQKQHTWVIILPFTQEKQPLQLTP
jgi:hypothetical protein